ncbi:MAG: KH domain-containing protein [Caldilineaceae bacterium]|nr:KH domain-containing protein [Caldilineaceae bacterium]
MEDLVEFLAKSLVEDPDAVHVNRKETRYATILKLRVAPEDMGRVIGRNGRVANAMRALLRAAARNENREVMLDID